VYTFDALDGFWNRTRGAWAQSEFLLRPNSGPTAAGFWIGPDVLATVAESHDPSLQPKTILGMLVNSPEVHRGPYNYLIRTDYPDELDLVALTERFPEMWVRAIRSEWVLSKNGDNHDLDEPGLRVVDEVYNQPDGLFPLLFEPRKAYLLPNGETATLWRRTVGQPYLPEPDPALVPLAAHLSNWLHEDAPLLLSREEQGLELGLQDLTPHNVHVMAGGLPAADTLFVLLHRGEPSDAAVWQQLQNDYVLAWDGWFGSEYLTVWGRAALAGTESTANTRFGDVTLTAFQTLPTVRSGSVLPLLTRWQVGVPPLKASYRLLDVSGAVVAQLDRDIAGENRLGLFIPPDTLPGTYTVAVTVYDPVTTEPVPPESGEPLAPITTVTVTP
jgi:hypothetical protein